MEVNKNNAIFCTIFNYKQCRQGLLKYFHQRTTQSFIPHTGDEAAYGIWMKHRNQYEFFRNAFINNKMTFKSDLASSEQTNQQKRAESGLIFQLYADMSHYKYMYIILGGLHVFIILFGVCYEVVRRRYSRGSEMCEEGTELNKV